MRREAGELRRDSTAILRTPRDSDLTKLFARHPPALVSEHRADVVDAIGVGHEAVIADLLGYFLDGAMEIADVRNRLAHYLAVGAHDEAQHAVRGGMLRPHVQRHFFGA